MGWGNHSCATKYILARNTLHRACRNKDNKKNKAALITDTKLLKSGIREVLMHMNRLVQDLLANTVKSQFNESRFKKQNV